MSNIWDCFITFYGIPWGYSPEIFSLFERYSRQQSWEGEKHRPKDLTFVLRPPFFPTYLIFVISLTLAGFFNPNILHPNPTQKNIQQLQQIAPISVEYAVFWVQSGRFYTGQNFFYTGTACIACYKYEVCSPITHLLPLCRLPHSIISTPSHYNLLPLLWCSGPFPSSCIVSPLTSSIVKDRYCNPGAMACFLNPLPPSCFLGRI